MSTGTAPAPETAEQLLRALERTGPHPVLAWYGEAARIELSGHVLANWVIKAIGHLHDEIALEPGELVVIDLPPHWKRLVLALAAWALGAEVRVLERGGAAGADERAAPGPASGREGAPDGRAMPDGLADVRVLVTDRPGSGLAGSADEVLALEPVSLAPRFSGELPPLVHDWLAEVRGSSDRLGVVLPAWSGPSAGAAPDAAPELSRAAASDAAPASAPRLLVEGDGLGAVPEVLGALRAGGGIVGPAAVVTERQAQEEAVTARV